MKRKRSWCYDEQRCYKEEEELRFLMNSVVIKRQRSWCYDEQCCYKEEEELRL